MAALCLFLVPVCFFDYTRYRIPNPLLFVMAVTGIAESFMTGGILKSLIFLIKAFLMIAALYPVFKIGAIGAGDVKLLGICAGFFKGDRILYFLFFSLLTAAIFSTVKMLKERNFRERFAYFFSYVNAVTGTGKWKLYTEDVKNEKKTGLCLSGPVLISIIMHMGGLY